MDERFQRLLRVSVPAAMLLGVGAALTAPGLPNMLRQVVCLGMLVGVVWKRPEVILALFLTCGAFKTSPHVLAALPADPTLVLGVLLMLGIGLRFHRETVRLPLPILLLLPLMLVVALSSWGTDFAYGAQKALRFGTLTALGIAGCLACLRDRRQFLAFVITLSVVATVVTILAAIGQQTDSTARLRLVGSSPITVGRMAVMALTFAWLCTREVRTVVAASILVPILLVSVYVAMAAGSRGPILSLLLGFIVLEFFARRYHNKSLLALPWSLGLVAVITVLFFSGVIPAEPLTRIQQAFTLEGDRSIDQRLALYERSLSLLAQHPFGVGVGGFAEHGVFNLRYPHNVFLEVGVELGWVPMLSLFVLCAWSLWNLIAVLKARCDWITCMFAMLVITSGINAMFTGDLNDNRMLFALLLVPFQYRTMIQADGSLVSTPPDEASAIHFASFFSTPAAFRSE